MGAERPASTSSRKATVCGSSVLSKANPRELPARGGREEVAIGSAAVSARCRAARALQHELAAHELAVVLADRTFGWREARVRSKGALRPFPDVAKHPAASARQNGPGLVELVSEVRIRGGREALPFGFSRQPSTGPAGVSVGLEITDVGDRRRPIDLSPSAQSELGALFVPVERRGAALALHPVPTLGQPERWRPVTPICNELAPLRVGHTPVRNLMTGQEHAVAGPLGVERETFINGTDFDDALASLVEAQWLHGKAHRRRQLAIGGLERVLGHGRQDVREEKLLVLLLMIDAQLDQVERGGR